MRSIFSNTEKSITAITSIILLLFIFLCCSTYFFNRTTIENPLYGIIFVLISLIIYLLTFLYSIKENYKTAYTAACFSLLFLLFTPANLWYYDFILPGIIFSLLYLIFYSLRRREVWRIIIYLIFTLFILDILYNDVNETYSHIFYLIISFFLLFDIVGDILKETPNKVGWFVPEGKEKEFEIIKNSIPIFTENLHGDKYTFFSFFRNSDRYLLLLAWEEAMHTKSKINSSILLEFNKKSAKKYLKEAQKQIKEINSQQEKTSYIDKLKKYFEKQKMFLLTAAFFTFLAFFTFIPLVGFYSKIINGFTPVPALTNRFFEKSKRKFNGAICRDGTTSSSQGSGTCSWHGGVRYYFYKGSPTKSLEECRREAEEISWIN